MSTKDAKKGKFYNTVAADGDAVIGKRAEMAVKSVKKAVGRLIDNIDDEVDTLESTLLKLADLGPNTTDSLRPIDEDFDAKAWVKSMHETTLDLKLKKIELENAEGILKEWF
jgi:hypothetical protein